MKFNGVRVKLYRDTTGPYDGYLRKGCVYPALTKHQTVTYAFDHMGQHYGVIRYKTHLREIILVIVLASLALFGLKKLRDYDGSEERLVVYMHHAPIVVNGDTLLLEITNLMEDSTYIIVGKDTYEITPGDTLISVPLISSVEYVTISYKGRITTMEISYE